MIQYVGTLYPGEVVITKMQDTRAERSRYPWNDWDSHAEELAVWLLTDALGDDDSEGTLALALSHRFRWEVVAHWPDVWSVTDIDIRGWVVMQP